MKLKWTIYLGLPQFNTYDFHAIKSHAGVRDDLFRRSLDETLITDFFGGVAHVDVVPSGEPENPLVTNNNNTSHGTFKSTRKKAKLGITMDTFEETEIIRGHSLRVWAGVFLTGCLFVLVLSLS